MRGLLVGVMDRFAEKAREMCPCTCVWPREPGMLHSYKPESIDGPLKDGSHYSGCESENREDFAQAFRDTWNEAIEAAAQEVDDVSYEGEPVSEGIRALKVKA